jgi:exportin-5
MKLLERDLEPQFQELVHIKDALSRVIVEMIKREWPQQWPTLLAELQAACGLGGSQTELVLFVFLRLAEDVALLQVIMLSFISVTCCNTYIFLPAGECSVP